jgi:hypothetical protein
MTFKCEFGPRKFQTDKKVGGQQYNTKKDAIKTGDTVSTRVARWHIFIPKIQIWVNSGVSCNRRCWYIFGHLPFLWTFDIFPGYLVYFWPFWYVVLRKIWQPWIQRRHHFFLSCTNGFVDDISCCCQLSIGTDGLRHFKLVQAHRVEKPSSRFSPTFLSGNFFKVKHVNRLSITFEQRRFLFCTFIRNFLFSSRD